MHMKRMKVWVKADIYVEENQRSKTVGLTTQPSDDVTAETKTVSKGFKVRTCSKQEKKKKYKLAVNT